MIDDFNGDNERLIACIEALLDLDEAKALVPHGIGGHARGLLSAAGVRLAAKDREITAHKVTISELAEQFDTLRADRDATASHLGELLAVIHRDGGRYQAEHGAAKAAKDALSKFASLRCELYDLRGEYDETAALFGAWQQRAEQSESERDEARECVKRLYSDFTKIRNDCVGCMKDMCDTYLAATPEHLRNA